MKRYMILLLLLAHFFSNAQEQNFQDDLLAVSQLNERFIKFLNDEITYDLVSFYSDNALVKLNDSSIFKGKETIDSGFARPYIARIRVVDSQSSSVENNESTITVNSLINARLLPSPDTLPLQLSNVWQQGKYGEWKIVMTHFSFPSFVENDQVSSRYFIFNNKRVHYLDFGGDGLPVVFIPSNDRTAFTYFDFASRFNDDFRVLAITNPGSGLSEGNYDLMFDPTVKTKAVIGLLDELSIEQAVMIDRYFHVPILLLENHKERLSGVVFLAGVAPDPYSLNLDYLLSNDPTDIIKMTKRYSESMLDGVPELNFSPRLFDKAKPVNIPVLFLHFDSQEPQWRIDYQYMIDLAQWSVQNPAEFKDSVSREYFQRLAKDEKLQLDVKEYHETVIHEQWMVAEKRFKDVFGESLQQVQLDGEHDFGYYHYRRAPDLIEEPVRTFLQQIEDE